MSAVINCTSLHGPGHADRGPRSPGGRHLGRLGRVQDDRARPRECAATTAPGLGWSEAATVSIARPGCPTSCTRCSSEPVNADRSSSPATSSAQRSRACTRAAFARRRQRWCSLTIRLRDRESIERTAARSGGAWPWLARIGLLRATRALSRHAAGTRAGARRRDTRVPESAGSSGRAARWRSRG